LWLHGIPGAGKTILASFIIQEVKQFCDTSGLNDMGWAYYYCYFGRNQDESHHFLRWIINQLCRQLSYVPGNLVSFKSLGDEPSSADLLDVLSTIVKKFRRVYIVVDALDESQNRRFIVDLLVKIVGDDIFQNISLLTTSRKELDISRAFEGLCSSISLSNPLVDEDICTYVESQLQTDHKFSRWPVSVRKDIRNALTKGAKGMYVSRFA
jgi:NACHT domain